jgi:transcriptional regulator with XRE-family HTH domain
VSIGAALAEARHQAGLTVAEVSAHTRIREGLIRAIEQDEFGSCGGDFYARGHIRAIAGFVGADAGALISEYDAEHPSGRPVTLEKLPSRPPPSQPPPSQPPSRPASRPPRDPGQHRGSWFGPAVLLLCIAVIVFIVYRLTPGTADPRPGAAASLNGASPRPAAASHGPRPSPRGALASSHASPRPAPKVTELTPVSAVAFGPRGTSDGDYPQGAPLALSGDPATPWHTDWYTTARFGNLQAGTGLLLRLGQTVTATSVTIRLGNTPGADLQVRAGTTPAHLRVVAGKADAGGTVRLRLASHPRVRYVLIWFTLLPPDAAGTYQAYISTVTVTATSG